MSKIVLLVASSGKNQELAEQLESLGKERGNDIELINLMSLKFPLYDTDQEALGVPEQASKLAESLKACDAYMVVAPEYNGLIPPVLNNAIAWISRSGESDQWRSAFNGKPVALATHSGGGGFHALTAIRLQLSYLGSVVLGRQLLTNYSKPLNIESAQAIFEQLEGLTAK